MSGQFSAQAHYQALGYLYQVRYALLLLLEAGAIDPEIQISIEFLDDIAFEKAGTPIELIQTKHHINSKASLSDSSTDLWKTLRIWCEAFLQNKMNLTDTTLTLITTERASEHSAASKLRTRASSCRNVGEALEMLRAIAQASGNKTNESAYNTFLRLSKEQQYILLSRIQILDCSPDILVAHQEIEKRLRHTTRPKFLQSVCQRLEGWWFDTVVKHLLSVPANVIHHRDLLFTLNDIQQQFYEDNLPIDFPDPIEAGEKEAETDERIFVEQLRLIGVNPKRLRKAIGDFYRSSSQRSEWLRADVLVKKELERYEARLCDEWERYYAMMEEEFNDDPAEEEMKKEGRELFNKIQQANLSIRSRCTAEYIMRGSYHILANQLLVGWHLEFHQRLQHLHL